MVTDKYDTWLSIPVATKLFGVSRRTLVRWVSRGLATRKRVKRESYYMVYSKPEEHSEVQFNSTSEQEVLHLLHSKFQHFMKTLAPPAEEESAPGVNQSVLCVCLSDTHVGKKTKTFNSEIAVSRLLELGCEIADVAVDLDADRIHLYLVGDIVDGEGIFPTQGSHIDMPAIEQAYTAAEVLAEAVKTIVANCELPVEIYTVPGNHGRSNRYVSEITNWDNVCYKMLALKLEGEEGIYMVPNLEEFFTVDVLDKRVTLNHKGIKNPGSKAQLDRATTWFTLFNSDVLVHGHWHSPGIKFNRDKAVISNGAMVGLDDYAERLGLFDEPRQLAFLVEEGRPITNFHTFTWS